MLQNNVLDSQVPLPWVLALLECALSLERILMCTVLKITRGYFRVNH